MESTCTGPQCDRPIANKKRQLCKTHAAQKYKGKELTPIGSTRTAFNKLYDEDSKCKGPQCDNKPVSKWLCPTHYEQRKAGKVLTVIGTTYHTKPDGMVRTCSVCSETKDWTLFVKGMDRPTGECHDCYRSRLLAAPDTSKEDADKRTRMNDLLAFIEKKVGTSATE